MSNSESLSYYELVFMNPQTLRQTTVNGGRSASLFWAFSLFTKLLGILGSAIATFDGLRKK